MFRIEHLTKKYGNTPVVDDVSFTILNGTICVLLGPNGAGKSTLIKSCAGLLTHSGIVQVGKDLTNSIDGKKRFAYIPEIPAIYDDLTVREHIEFMANAYGITDYRDALENLLDLFELRNVENSLGMNLSKGMMQKVSICMALITNPECILVDEPLVGLDPKGIKTLKKILLQKKEEGASILISTHMLEMVDDLWDEIIVLKKGKVIGHFLRSDLNNESVKQKFFELTEGVDSCEGY